MKSNNNYKKLWSVCKKWYEDQQLFRQKALDIYEELDASFCNLFDKLSIPFNYEESNYSENLKILHPECYKVLLGAMTENELLMLRSEKESSFQQDTRDTEFLVSKLNDYVNVYGGSY